jgi:gamma-glutamyltranspeptidase/glutathione hydrolase
MRRLWLIVFVSVCLSHQAVAQQAAIATAHPLATQAGKAILKQGGNAFDAAIAITATLAVVEPAGSGIGGGGFWLLHDASDGKQRFLDGREMAPGASHADMYLDKGGVFQPELSLNGPLAAGIPGVPAALVHLAEHYGALSLAQTLAPAIHHAEQGFKVGERYQRLARFRLPVMQGFEDTAATLLNNGKLPELGHVIKQPDLANTLKQLADQGHAGFYEGDIANKLVNAVRQYGGIWTLDDLKRYQVIEREPITGQYHDYTITSAPLPSSGGLVLMLALNQLTQFDLTKASTVQQRHLVIEALRRAYRERSLHMGDSDFATIPNYLSDIEYGQYLAASIDPEKANHSEQLYSPRPLGEDTTHFSVMDNQGNRVSATLSINYPFGSGFIAKGTGVLLNDEMDDFSAQPGVGNAYGLVGNSANAIAPYKRPLSSMTPSFIESPDKLMITGTPGGSRIISMTLLSVLEFIAGKTAKDIVTTPRYHHQYLPDEVQIENHGFSAADIAELEQRGHTLKPLTRQYGDMHIIVMDKTTNTVTAASDPRGEGQSWVSAEN